MALAQKAFAGLDGKVKQLDELVRDSMKTNSENMIIDVGPIFGKLNAQSLANLDEATKVMIVGLTRQIADIPIKDRTYDRIKSLCSQSPLIETAGEGQSKADSFIKTASAAFKFDGSPENAVMKEVDAWYQKLVGDPDILAGASIDIDVLGRVVAQSGATVEDGGSFLQKRERAEKNLDLAGIIYPQPDKPIFRLFRIHLTAWSDSDRTLFLQTDQNGITGEIHVTEYQPRRHVIDSLQPGARVKAVEMATGFFH